MKSASISTCYRDNKTISDTEHERTEKRTLMDAPRGSELMGRVGRGKSSYRVTAKKHCRILKTSVAIQKGVGGC